MLTARPDLSPLIEPLLSSAATQAEAIKRLDREIKSRAKAIAVCRQLMTIPGVAHNTALAYVATIDDARRFAKSRDVGAYVGLTSRRHQSGEMDYSGRISKHGDALLRSLLYESANSLLTVVRKAHPLKDWARRIRRRSSHKKACVALARKLAVIMHRMMITGEAFRWPEGGERDAGGGLARSLTETSDHTDPRKRKRRPQPGRWPRRSRQFGCKPDRCPRVRVIPWEAEAKGHYDEASGPTAGNDFGDNRVPGKGQKAGSGGLDRETGIIPTVIDQNPCAHLRMPRDMIFHGWSMRLFQAWQHSADVFIRFDNQLSRMNCQTFSTGFNSGDRGGSARTVMLSGIASLGASANRPDRDQHRIRRDRRRH